MFVVIFVATMANNMRITPIQCITSTDSCNIKADDRVATGR